MSINILIAEDDIFISEHLKQILIDLNYNVCGIVSSYDQAVDFFSKEELPQLALLDIRMHGEDQGIRIAEYLNTLKVPFIYITSFSDKKTVQLAVAQEPKGYIVKPFSEEEIEEVLSKVVVGLRPIYITIKDAFSRTKILINEIQYMKSENVYVEIYTKRKMYITRCKLSELIEEIEDENFVRVHRSYVVNKKFIERSSSQEILVNGERIPVSRSYKEAVQGVF
jgi:DNA-binding LytR/AlgR family response regulator